MELTNLAAALAKAQSEMRVASKSGYNPHFKSNFSTLEDLIDASRPSLTKYGLSVVQYPDSVGEEMYLVTKLKHASGQEEMSKVRLFLKDPTDIQKLGSALSYMKRYTYAGMCGISISESDDDGHSNSSVEHKPVMSPIQQAPSLEVKSEYISTKQLGYLKMLLSKRPGKEQEICKKYAISSMQYLPWKKMNEVVSALELEVPKAPAAKSGEPQLGDSDFDELPF